MVERFLLSSRVHVSSTRDEEHKHSVAVQQARDVSELREQLKMHEESAVANTSLHDARLSVDSCRKELVSVDHWCRKGERKGCFQSVNR